MNKIKGFSWDGIDEKYKWVAQDYSGDIYVYNGKPILASNGEKVWCCEDKDGNNLEVNSITPRSYIENEDWENTLQQRNPSEFNRENFEAYIDSLTGSHKILAQSSLKEFGEFLNSRKQIHQEIKEAIALLEKSGYNVNINKENV